MDIERRVRRGGCWSNTGIFALVDIRYGVGSSGPRPKTVKPPWTFRSKGAPHPRHDMKSPTPNMPPAE